MTSPDGSIVVVFTGQEMRMSVWVHEPLVYRTRDEALVLALDGTLLDATTGLEFPGPHLVRLPLRRYPRGDKVRYDLLVDVEAETFGLDGAEPTRPLWALRKVVRELG
jgi:hypothetical protein